MERTGMDRKEKCFIVTQSIQEKDRSSIEKHEKRRTMISVKEMGDLLGLKKTERYWLVHKNFFKTKTIIGKMWVDIASFESWYANQLKYKKVSGEEPGQKIQEWSYSVKDISQMLGICEAGAYDLINALSDQGRSANRCTVRKSNTFSSPDGNPSGDFQKQGL